MIETRKLGFDERAKFLFPVSEDALGNDSIEPRVVVEKKHVAVFEVAEKLVPASATLRGGILKVQAAVAEIHPQRAEIVLFSAAKGAEKHNACYHTDDSGPI